MNLKIIVGLLAGLLVIQIIGAFIYFFVLVKPQPEDITELGPTTSVIDPNTPGNGLIKLETANTTVSVNDDVTVTVVIDTNDKSVEGVDLSLKYDPAFVEPRVLNRVPFVAGRLFPDVPLNSFDNRLGVASMSAISSLNQNFVGNGTLAQITFRAKKAGNTSITIQAQPDNTTDSNMVSNGREILARTENLNLTIQP